MPVPDTSPDSATESVAVSGTTQNPMGSLNSDEFRERVQEFQQQNRCARWRPVEVAEARAGVAAVLAAGAAVSEVHPVFSPAAAVAASTSIVPMALLFYTVGDSALNAGPFALTDQPSTKPSGMTKQLRRLDRRPAEYSAHLPWRQQDVLLHQLHRDRATRIPTTNTRPFLRWPNAPAISPIRRLPRRAAMDCAERSSRSELYNPFTGQLIPGANSATSILDRP